MSLISFNSPISIGAKNITSINSLELNSFCSVSEYWIVHFYSFLSIVEFDFSTILCFGFFVLFIFTLHYSLLSNSILLNNMK